MQLLASLLLMLTTWLVWHQALPGGFIFDDLPNLVRANGWRAESLAPSAIFDAMDSGLTSEGGRPLAILSFAINHALTGPDPWWLKATSLAMHAINSVLVAMLVRHLLAAMPPTLASPRAQMIAAWLTALAWATHPIQASTVAYAVQRMEIGAAMGVLLSLLAYVQFRQRQIAGRRAWPLLALAAMAWAAGLGFKESAALAPALALLVEWRSFNFRSSEGTRDRRILGTFAFCGVLAATAFVFVVVPLTSASAYAPRAFDALGRTSTQFPVLGNYLAMIFWPDLDAFRFYYDDFPISPTPWHDAKTITAIAVVVGLVATAWLVRNRWPLITFGTFWFFVCHAITSSPIPLELAFEHRNYLALLGPFLVLATMLIAATQRLHGDARIAIGAAIVLALATLGAIQAATWGDPTRLALTLENRAPTSARAAYGFASQMVEVSAGDRTAPAWSLGMSTLYRAAELPSRSPLIPQAIIILHARNAEPISESVWQQFRELLLRRPLGPEAIESLYAVIQCRTSHACQFQDAELVSTVLEVIQGNPESATAHTMYANVAWNVLGDPALAIRMQREALSLSGGDARIALGLAEFLFATEESDAIAEGHRVLASVRQTSTGRATLEAIADLEYRYPPPATN